MSTKTKMAVCAEICTLWLILSLLSVVYACQVEDFYFTKEGSIAAVTPQELNDVLASTADNQAKLADLLKAGTVVKLKEGVKVQVLERSVEWKMLKIKFPDGNATYWVKDGSLRQIDCNK
jgi:hypothetical protein